MKTCLNPSKTGPTPITVPAGPILRVWDTYIDLILPGSRTNQFLGAILRKFNTIEAFLWHYVAELGACFKRLADDERGLGLGEWATPT